MKSYPQYKDSQVKWLGQVPQHWEVIRAKNLFVRMARPVREDDEIITCFRDGEVTLRKNRRTEGFTESFKEIGYQGIRKGDLVIHQMDAFAGAIGVSDSDGKGTPVYICLQPKADCDNVYYAHLLREMARSGYIKSLYRGIRERSSDFRYETFARLPLPLPPLSEQLRIVDYLEGKVSGMDRFVSLTTQKVETLRALRQATIQQAVTKGIQLNTTLKNTNIKWIPKVPQHWEVKKIKYVFSERSEKGFPEEPVLCSTQKYGVIPQSMYENRVVVVNKGLEGLKLVREGDFVISLRSFQGGIEYAHYQGIISAAYTILKKADDVDAAYLKFLLKSHGFILLLQTCVTGIREGQNINYSMLRKESLPLPPLSEQREIVAYLNEKCAKIDQLIDNYQQQIERIKLLKQALIADVVTGKVDIRPSNV